MPHSSRFNPVTIIRQKRDGNVLKKEEIFYLINEYTGDRIPDYQMSAFLMAALIKGLNNDEASYLTHAMLHSGKVLDLSDIRGKKVDKHSTGGVGDKLSLILAPIVASYGVPVPMISGRGLGHTGGTLDKLESITGFCVDMSLSRCHEILSKQQMVMAGQTEDIAPADKRLYALRDVTATVESIPLIASSIMSKKLAEGIDALVLDVKFGSGAFMNTIEDAQKLAETLISIGESFGKETIAYLTNMDQPLGHHVGNWLEVKESVDALRGEGPDDIMEVTHLLAGTMIYLGGKAQSVEEGVEMSKEGIRNGQALNQWKALVAEQGGDVSLLDHPERYPAAQHMFTVEAAGEGYIQSMNAYEIGIGSLELGAGRRTKEDVIDPAAGLILKKKIGDYVKKGETLMTGFTNNEQAIETAMELCSGAIVLGADIPEPIQMVTHRVDISGTRLLAEKR